MLKLKIKEVVQKLNEGKIIAVELCNACIKRAQNVKELNAFVTLLEGNAIEQAKCADKKQPIGNGTPKGSLEGVTVAVKDNFCTQGVLTTCASKMLANFTPTYNATVVQRLRDAGAIITGKTNMDEFAMGSGTVDSIHGPTINIWGSKIPYSLKKGATTLDGYSSYGDRIAGGSSGGSAVAVATGSCFAALGSDTGGSTRNPASYCGIVGLKPTYGSVSRHGLIPLVNSMDVPGILARSVEDVVCVFNAISGFDEKDSTTVDDNACQVTISDDFSVSGIRVGIPKEYFCEGLSKEVLEAWRATAELLRKAGSSVVEVSLPHTPYSIACYSVLNQCEVASNMARYDGLEFGYRSTEDSSTEQLYAESRSAAFNYVVRGRILAGNYFLLQSNYEKYFEQALKVRRLIAEDFDKVWPSIDVLLTPTTLTDPPLLKDFLNLDNRAQCVTQDFCTQPANMSGCPAVSFPVRLSSNGLPISLQLMSANFSEQTLLSVCHWLENVLDFPVLEIEDNL